MYSEGFQQSLTDFAGIKCMYVRFSLFLFPGNMRAFIFMITFGYTFMLKWGWLRTHRFVNVVRMFH